MDTGQDFQKDKTHLKYGLISGGLLIALFLLFYLMRIGADSGVVAFIPPILFMLLVLVSQFVYANKVEEPAFGNIFAKGFKTTAVATSVFVIFLILFILLVPEYKDIFIELQKERIHADAARLKLSPEQIRQSIDDYKAHFMMYQVRSTVLKELVLGLIASVVGAAVAPKNKKPQLEPLS